MQGWQSCRATYAVKKNLRRNRGWSEKILTLKRQRVRSAGGKGHFHRDPTGRSAA